MAHGKVEYNADGLPKCEICGQYFDRVTQHARQKHEISAADYKKRFGLDSKKGICSKESAQKTREKTLYNYDKVVKRNLLEKGCPNRFVKGSGGRTKDQVSEQTRIMLKERLKTPAMVNAMQGAGKKLGKSGLGNKTRWGNKNQPVKTEQ